MTSICSRVQFSPLSYADPITWLVLLTRGLILHFTAMRSLAGDLPLAFHLRELPSSERCQAETTQATFAHADYLLAEYGGTKCVCY